MTVDGKRPGQSGDDEEEVDDDDVAVDDDDDDGDDGYAVAEDGHCGDADAHADADGDYDCKIDDGATDKDDHSDDDDYGADACNRGVNEDECEHGDDEILSADHTRARIYRHSRDPCGKTAWRDASYYKTCKTYKT